MAACLISAITLTVTGASSGFGRAVTEVVLQHGEIAVATLRSPSDLAILQESHGPDQLLVVKCDVTIPSDIKAAFQLTTERFGRCDVVFNNAGYAVVAEIEGTPDDAVRAMFEVNFWGATNVSREAVRVFRELNPKSSGGLLLNVSSNAGPVPSPAVGYYAARCVCRERLVRRRLILQCLIVNMVCGLRYLELASDIEKLLKDSLKVSRRS